MNLDDVDWDKWADRVYPIPEPLDGSETVPEERDPDYGRGEEDTDAARD